MNRKERTILITLFIDALLVAVKFWLANASGSLSLQAGAIHSVGDLFLGVFILVGLLLARTASVQRRNATALIENILAVIVGVFMLYAAFDIFRDVMQGGDVELKNLLPVTLAALLTVVVAWFTSRYKLYVGKQTESPALIASGYHARIDLYASIVVVAGLAGSALGLPNLDRAAAVIVVLFIVYTAYEILRDAIAALRGHRAIEIDEHAEHAPGNWRRLAFGALAIFVALYLLSGFYVVQAEQVAVVRRFGQVVFVAGPGLQYRFPWPIDRADFINPSAVRRIETKAALMMTGDQSLVNVRVGAHYVVDDAAAYLFQMVKPDDVVRQAAEAAMRQVVAEKNVDALLTTDKAAIQQRALQVMQETLQGYKAGLRAVDVQLLESSPPEPVAAAFRDVASAREDKNTFVNEALAYQNEIVPVARGNAEKMIQGANAYQSDKVGRATGEANRFLAREGAYASAPAVTRLRLYLEAVERALATPRKFILDPRVKLESTDLWLTGSGATQTFPPAPNQ